MTDLPVTDIVDRLRSLAASKTLHIDAVDATMREAAIEIEHLRDQLRITGGILSDHIRNHDAACEGMAALARQRDHYKRIADRNEASTAP